MANGSDFAGEDDKPGRQTSKKVNLKNASLPKVILRSVLLSSLLLHSQGLVSILDPVFFCHGTLEREDRNVALCGSTGHLPKLRHATKKERQI